MRVAGAVVVLMLVACSGSDDPGAPTTTHANPCATKGATYLFHLIEHANGTCGPFPDQVINTSEGGELSSGPVTCDSFAQDGCTGRNSGCVSQADGTTCRSTSSVTFQADGSTARGVQTITCTAGSSTCSSTYDVYVVRQ